MQFGRGHAWILGVAVIGVVALLYFGRDGTQREQTPPEVLGTRGSEAVDPSSPAGAGTRESRLAAAREKDRGVARGRLDRGADAPAAEAIQEGSSRAAAERLDTEGRTGEGAPDRPVSDADRAVIEAFLRAAAEALRAGSEAAGRDDGAAPETPGERDDQGDQGRGGASEPTLEGVSIRSNVMVTCTNSPSICNYFSSPSSNLPGTISVVSDGIEAVLIPIPGEADVVYIRTGIGFILARTDNLTNAGQLGALIEHLVPRP